MKQARRPDRAGQSLVEFALVALVLYMLLAAILTFGHALYVAQGLQGAADLAAREISRTPLPAVSTFDEALEDADVRDRIYDRAYLVIDLDNFFKTFIPPDGEPTNVFSHLVPTLPLLNQQLVPLMIVDRPVIEGTQRRLLRFPGAIIDPSVPIQHPRSDEGEDYESWVETNLTVSVPVVSPNGSIQMVGVVEEIAGAGGSPFDVSNPPTNGVVALRMNYPFQSASMSSFRPNREGPFEPTIGTPVTTNDDADVGPGQVYSGTYGGTNGLGVQGVQGQRVRPFRRVITAQAIYRREVFSN